MNINKHSNRGDASKQRMLKASLWHWTLSEFVELNGIAFINSLNINNDIIARNLATSCLSNCALWEHHLMNRVHGKDEAGVLPHDIYRSNHQWPLPEALFTWTPHVNCLVSRESYLRQHVKRSEHESLNNGIGKHFSTTTTTIPTILLNSIQPMMTKSRNKNQKKTKKKRTKAVL